MLRDSLLLSVFELQTLKGFSAQRMWKHGISAVCQHVTRKSAKLDHDSILIRRRNRITYQVSLALFLIDLTGCFIQALFRGHLHSLDPEDLPWRADAMTVKDQTDFKQLRKQLSVHEIIAYEAAEMIRVFAEKRKYWVRDSLW